MIFFKHIITRYYWLLLSLLHVILMMLLYLHFGFNYQNEGAKYILQATEVVNGQYDFHINYNSFYITYVFYLAFFIALKIPLCFVFFSTYLLSLFAYYKFYKMLQHTINNIVSKLWLACMLLSPFMQYWQFNLFSETFFIALSLYYVSIVFQFQQHSYLRLLLLTIPLLLARPNALFLFFVAILFLIYQYKIASRRQVVIIGLALLITATLIVVFYLSLPYNDFTVLLTSGAVYCGFPTLKQTTLLPGNYTLWNCYVYNYQTYGFATVAELFFKKFGSFFITARPYYSTWHSVLNQAHSLFYLLAVVPFAYWRNHTHHVKSMLWLIITFIFLNALMVGFIYNEWSERHTVQVFPFIFVIASMGVYALYQKRLRSL